jgi:hypothetical protein
MPAATDLDQALQTYWRNCNEIQERIIGRLRLGQSGLAVGE